MLSRASARIAKGRSPGNFLSVRHASSKDIRFGSDARNQMLAGRLTPGFSSCSHDLEMTNLVQLTASLEVAHVPSPFRNAHTGSVSATLPFLYSP